MKQLILIPLFAFSFGWLAVAATQVPLSKAGEARLTVGWLFNVYDASYYVQEGMSPEASVMNDSAKRLQLRYLRNIPKDQFIQAATDMMTGFLDEKAIQSYAEPISLINEAYEDVSKGDEYALEYQPGSGTRLFLNGKEKVLIPGADFARDYFRIWTDPACKYRRFRSELLGIR